MNNDDATADPRQQQPVTAETKTRRTSPFHAVLLGFCLTVLMAAGAGHALALWSQSAAMTIQVRAGTVPSPELQCAKVPNEASVRVTWTPQRPGVTGYDVTVTEDGRTIKTASYLPEVNTEKITAPAGLVYEHAYTVTVTAHYGSWQAQPSGWYTITATKPLLALTPTISCS